MSDLDRLKAALADRYEIEREIGQGGMATVYLAHDLRHDREVAESNFLPTSLGPTRRTYPERGLQRRPEIPAAARRPLPQCFAVAAGSA